MQVPGEALLTKLWETLTDRAIGNLLKPWQIRREGRAHTDVQQEALLRLAQAERHAAAIRSGDARLTGTDYRLQIEYVESATIPAQAVLPAAQTSPETKIEPYQEINRAEQADTLRREVNVGRAILHAEDALAGDQHPPSQENPSEDWMYRWRDYAASVSAGELQLLWGRVLAGEIRSPGVYSLRFLNFLHTIDAPEAELIATAMPFVIQDFIARDCDSSLESAGLSFSRLLELQDLGVISGVDGLGFSKTFNRPPQGPFRQLLRSYRHGIGLIAEGEQQSFDVSCYLVTALGQQLSRLGNFEANVSYLQAVGASIKPKGFKVQVGVVQDLDGTTSRLINAVEV